MGSPGWWSASKGSSKSKESVNPAASLDNTRTGTSAVNSSLPGRASAAPAPDVDERLGRDRVPRGHQPYKDPIVKAIADYAATAVVDKVSPGPTVGEQADSSPELEAAADVDTVSGWLQGAATSALEAPAVSIGLTPGEAAISAGIGNNLVLAPITGPLEQVSTYLELAGLAVALATGSHPLVLACIKPLLHTELEHALSHCIEAVVSGLLDAPQAGAHQRPPGALERLQILTPTAGTLPATRATASHQFVPAERPSVSREAPSTPRKVSRDEALWLCLAFTPKPARSAPATGTGTIAQERDVTKPVVLPIGDDNFLRTLPEALRDGSVAEVDLPTATTMRDLPAGRHVILKMEGVSIAVLSTGMDSQTAYQHPGCRAGRCVPLGGPPCRCTCSVCMSP